MHNRADSPRHLHKHRAVACFFDSKSLRHVIDRPIFRAALEAYALRNRSRMRSTIMLLCLAAAGGLAFVNPHLVCPAATLAAQAQAYSTRTCADDYNDVLSRAKQALANGNRAATLELLTRARLMAAQCPELQDEGTQVSIALACNSR